MIRKTSQALNLTILFVAFGVLISGLFFAGRATLAAFPAPPSDWASSAAATDLLNLAGYTIPYWGKPDAPYGVTATKRKTRPRAVIVHFTRAKPVLNMVKYGHARDFSRGGGSYGYHFYVGRGGRIAQGAPLSKRTNHIKPTYRKQRTKTARHLWSGNTIGISLIGGCDPIMEFEFFREWGCSGEYLTRAQRRAGLDLIRAIQAKFDIPCGEVYGHGELQTDRRNFEGKTLTDMARASCPEMPKNS